MDKVMWDRYQNIVIESDKRLLKNSMILFVVSGFLALKTFGFISLFFATLTLIAVSNISHVAYKFLFPLKPLKTVKQTPIKQKIIEPYKHSSVKTPSPLTRVCYQRMSPKTPLSPEEPKVQLSPLSCSPFRPSIKPTTSKREIVEEGFTLNNIFDQIDKDCINSWAILMRKWLCRHVLQNLVLKINNVDSELTKLNLQHLCCASSFDPVQLNNSYPFF
jgi:hypothetical protein